MRKCVAFVGIKLHDGSFAMKGTAFWVGKTHPGLRAVYRIWLITARHVIDGVRGTGVATVALRMNATDGEAKWFETRLDEWYFHPDRPDVDVAIANLGIPDGHDHVAIPHSWRITDEYRKNVGIAAGDEVAIVGLFAHHHGETRNVPILRTGNIATLDDEPIVTAQGVKKLHLVEVRSTGGLSGSPVFHVVPPVRAVDGELEVRKGKFSVLFGLMHGHFDERHEAVKVNVGIGMVVPARDIELVIDAWEAQHLTIVVTDSATA
jgi:hypothetical protein